MTVLSETILYRLLDASDTGLIGVAPNGSIAFWNGWMESRSNRRRQSVLGRRLDEVFPTADGGRVFEAVEQARIESLGARRFAGIAANLRSALEQRSRLKGYDQVSSPEEAPVADAIGALVRERLHDQPLPASAKHLADLWRPWFEDKAGKVLFDLAKNAEDQEAFAKLIREMIEDLDIED